ncbi:hypothetical protein [Parachryseolinea silvisoli]|uniref:hypothetical protein n=1 Tax=Parachryseolinea silvisoli TaxID=2873601 RepID=UPI002265A800|nr:hypothetical protein [Parachryseolinea silvisoli]MCD9018057.1 hypothetical protein [Parachryseolinea silvisoli]
MKQTLMAGIGILVLFWIMAFHGPPEIIPRTWDMPAIHRFHLPPPDSSVRVQYAPEEYYYGLPEHKIYRAFPVYVREFEKRGYLDSLRACKPEIVFDPARLKTPEDWINAGALVFHWPMAYTPVKDSVSALDLDRFSAGRGRLTKEGVYPALQYVIDGNGALMLGSMSCATCHTHILPDGTVVPGGQGNVFNGEGFARALERGDIPFPYLEHASRQLNYAPWAPETLPVSPVSGKDMADYVRQETKGIIDRQGGGHLYPFAVPSLVGIRDIRYLDHTGLMRHDGPGDMMRYAAFNQGMDMLTSYDGFMPGGKNNATLPAPAEWSHPFGYVGKRYSDAQLYALTQYLYSLKPPKNPNTFPRAILQRGEQVFKNAGCVTCHTPPLYTNNKLTPAGGFEPPEDHYAKYDIFNVSVHTDSVSTLYTRRGTGYYKIPSLRGVWYREAFFHNGPLAALEDILDPRRLQPDYVPTGFKPPHVKTMAVKGHPFGLALSDADKKALVAFMKTL